MKTYDELLAERDALLAQVDVLSNKLSEVAALLDVDGMSAVQWLLDNCQEIESLTEIKSQQHLAEIRAESILQAIKFFAPSLDIDVEALEAYAAKIRNAGTWLKDSNVNGGKRQGGE